MLNIKKAEIRPWNSRNVNMLGLPLSIPPPDKTVPQISKTETPIIPQNINEIPNISLSNLSLLLNYN